jgi:signal transduction histidine kinase
MSPGRQVPGARDRLDAAPADRVFPRAPVLRLARVVADGLAETLVRPEPGRPRPALAIRRLRRVAVGIGGALLVLAALFTVGEALSLFGVLQPSEPVVVRLPSLVMGSPGFVALDLPALLVGLGALLLAAARPLMAWRIGLVWCVLVPFLPAQVSLGPVEPLLFLLAAVGRRRPARWTMAAATLYPLWQWTGPGLGRFTVFAVVLLAVTIALDVHARSQLALATQTARREQEEARGAVLAERNRIARELHDVVAHHLSLIAVQAETARYRVGDLPDSALGELGSISAQARTALTDMRRLLGVLRNDAPVDRAPQPALHDVATLVSASRRAGMPVSLAMADDTGPVPPSVGVCAYRILQEALSNAGRHAPGAAVEVRVERVAQELRLQVANGAPAGPVPGLASGRPGHGLVGMRERVSMLGGSLATFTLDGGFVVSAALPLEEPVASGPR